MRRLHTLLAVAVLLTILAVACAPTGDLPPEPGTSGNIAGQAAFALGDYAPPIDFVVDPDLISVAQGSEASVDVLVKDEFVYYKGYALTKDGQWREFSFDGSRAGNWIITEARANIPVSLDLFEAGENSVIAYSCSKSANLWYCNNNKWMRQTFIVSEEGELPPEPTAPGQEDEIPGGCTTDVMQCPDGSYVSRNLDLNCDFAACPTPETAEEEEQQLTQFTDYTWSVEVIDDSANVGRSSAIVAPAADQVYVAYTDLSGQNLRFAKKTGTGWEKSTIDNNGYTRPYNSIAAFGTQTIYNLYYDGLNRDLRAAVSTDGGASWSFALVDDAGDVGTYNSIVVSPDSTDGRTAYAAYYSSSSRALFFTKTTDGGMTWMKLAVDTSNAGSYASIAALSGGRIVIAYYDSINSGLKIATSADEGATWNVQLVDRSKAGQYTSISARSNTLFVSYMGLNDLRLAISDDGGQTWGTQTADPDKAITGFFTSVGAVGNVVLVSMYDVTNLDMVVMSSFDKGLTWTKKKVDASRNAGLATALAVDKETGKAYVSYYDSDSKVLKLATGTPVVVG